MTNTRKTGGARWPSASAHPHLRLVPRPAPNHRGPVLTPEQQDLEDDLGRPLTSQEMFNVATETFYRKLALDPAHPPWPRPLTDAEVAEARRAAKDTPYDVSTDE